MEMEKSDDQDRQINIAFYGRTIKDVASSHVVIKKYSYLRAMLLRIQGPDVIYH